MHRNALFLRVTYKTMKITFSNWARKILLFGDAQSQDSCRDVFAQLAVLCATEFQKEKKEQTSEQLTTNTAHEASE